MRDSRLFEGIARRHFFCQRNRADVPISKAPKAIPGINRNAQTNGLPNPERFWWGRYLNLGQGQLNIMKAWINATEKPNN